MKHDAYQALAILGVALLSLLTRGFFVLPKRNIPLPQWLRIGLRYAPLAALMAIVVPGVVLDNGRLTHTLWDAQVIGACAGIAWYVWRRDLLGTIVSGTAVMLFLRLGLGWP